MIQIGIQNFSRETIATAAIISCVTILGTLWYQRQKRHGVPTKWVPIGKVKNLYLYPLKSGRRTELETAICTEFGLMVPKAENKNLYQFRDRNLMIYKEGTKDNYHHSKMHLIETAACDEDHFVLNAPGMSAIKVRFPTHSESNKADETKIWTTEKIYMIDCGDEIARWLSEYILGKDSGLRMGYHDALQRRDITQAFAEYLKYYPNLRNEATGLYSSVSSYLVLNQASVEDINNRLPENNITANNFRPNILVEGAKPFAEDNWEWLRIGDIIFYYVMPCTRCVITTLDPETAKRAQNYEPVKTLKTYRQLKKLKNIDLNGNRPVMGINMGLLNEGGKISIGDTVYLGKY